MSRAEQYSWLSLAGLAAVFWWFQMRMLDGFTVADQSAARLFGVYVAVIAASTFLELTIAALVWRGRPPERDERDAAIEARANLAERVAIIAAVNVVIWQALMEGVYSDHVLPHIDLARLPVLFFVLLAILYGGEMVKRATTIWFYRAQAARD